MRFFLTASRMFVVAAALTALATSGCATSGGGPLAGITGAPGADAMLPSQAAQPALVSNPASGQYSRSQLASFGRTGYSANPLSGYSSNRSSGSSCGFG